MATAGDEASQSRGRLHQGVTAERGDMGEGATNDLGQVCLHDHPRSCEGAVDGVCLAF
jgi:hypothetical protein